MVPVELHRCPAVVTAKVNAELRVTLPRNTSDQVVQLGGLASEYPAQVLDENHRVRAL